MTFTAACDIKAITCLLLSDRERSRAFSPSAPAGFDDSVLDRGTTNTSAELSREAGEEVEDVLIAGVMGITSLDCDGALVTCLVNAAIALIQNFPGVLKGNNRGRICAASAVRAKWISHPERMGE